MPAQIGEAQVGAVRVAVDVPLPDAESLAERGEVGCVLGGVVRREVVPLGRQAVPALFRREDQASSGGRRVVGQAHGGRVEPVHLRAGEVRL